VAAVAARAGVPFIGLWLEASQAELERRLAARVGDASDAGVAVLRGMIDRPLGAIAWARLDAADPELVARARALLPGGSLGRAQSW